MTTKDEIIVLADARAMPSLYPLIPCLKTSFPNRPILELDSEEFIWRLANDRAWLAVIPGIGPEKSKYFDLLGGEEGQKIIQDSVARGTLLMTICAGSYLISKQTEYHTSWGTKRERTNNNAIFNALARGPVGSYGLEPKSDAWWDGCQIIPVAYKNEKGGWEKAKIAYGNGPALYPSQDCDLEVLARYDESPGKPIAAAWKKVGKGGVLWLGILPHTGYEDPQQFERKLYKDFIKALEPHDQKRQEFWNTLVQRVERHMRRVDGQSIQIQPIPA